MTIEEGIKLQGCPAKIPDCSRDELPKLCVQMGYKKGAEVGVYKGAFTEKFCKLGIFMYAIDPWKAFTGQGRTQNDQARQDFLYGHTQRTLAPYKENYQIIRATSLDAVKQFKNGSLDFVYLDGDHSFQGIAEDLYVWAPKVRKGGIVSGHDYFDTSPQAQNIICHVASVVDAYTKVFQIKNWYLFGLSGKPLDQESRDNRVLSWFWFQP